MRGYGAGSVFPEKEQDPATGEMVETGRFLAMWERPRLNGRRRRGSRVADTEAEAWRKMREAQRGEGRSSSQSRARTETVGAFLDRWLADVVAREQRERTLVGYRAIVTVAKPAIGAFDLRSPRLAHEVQAFVNKLDRHPRTVQHYAACLRTAFGYAVRKHLMEENPAVGLTLPAIVRTERIPLTPEQLRAFLAASTDDPLHALWTCAGWTGMRQGELLGLRWQDVDTERASLVVRASLARLPGPKRKGKRSTRYVLTEPKTERSRRTIPLLPEVVETLIAIRKRQMLEPGELSQGLVFCTPAGSPLDAGDVSKAFRLAVKRAGLPQVRMHDLRHGFATHLIQRGVDLATVGAILGHSNIGTTVDIYGHLTEQHKRAAVARLVEVAG